MRLVRNAVNGFTLLEVMVALAIFGISILLLIQIFSGGLNMARATDSYTSAVIYARAKMNETLLDKNIDVGRQSGLTNDGFKWGVEVTQADNSSDDDANSRVRLLKVVVKVHNSGRRGDVSLATLKTVMRND